MKDKKVGIVTCTLDKWEINEIKKSINSLSYDLEIIEKDNVFHLNPNDQPYNNQYISILGRVERPILNIGISILKFYENKGEKVINNSKTITIGQNKFLTSLELSKNNIQHPKTFFSFTTKGIMKVVKNYKFPLVLKPWIGGRGEGIVKIDSIRELNNILTILDVNKQPVYLQEYVGKRIKARDLRVFVVGNKVVGGFYRIAPEGFWKTNICNGGIPKKCNLTEEINELAIKAAKAINAQIAGVDIIETEKGLMVLEVNVCPMFKGFYEITGINPAFQIAHLLTEG